MCQLSAPQFHDEDKAREYLESIRWATGVVCPHCGVIGEHYRLDGEAHRKGLWKCKDCRKQFTVTVGTVFERSKIPLHKWLMATFLMCSSKKGISSHQLHRILGITYKTAWFMTHRLREAMKDDNFTAKLGGGNNPVEVDETYFGNWKLKKLGKPNFGGHFGDKIVSLVERDGNVRSFHVTQTITAESLRPIMEQNIKRDTHVMTDGAQYYKPNSSLFRQHSSVNHKKGEYVRGEVHTNTVEGFFSILKRGVFGTFHHVGSQHLKRYVCEFDFRYNHRKLTDAERTDVALRAIAGKRLMYTTPS